MVDFFFSRDYSRVFFFCGGGGGGVLPPPPPPPGPSTPLSSLGSGD